MFMFARRNLENLFFSEDDCHLRAYGKARIGNPEPKPETETETEPEPEPKKYNLETFLS